MPYSNVNLVQGEAKTLGFTVRDVTTSLLNLTSATMTFEMKVSLTSNAMVTVNDASFNKTIASSGYVSVGLTSTNLSSAGGYYGVLTTNFNAGNIDKNVFRITVLGCT
jgi:type IV secretory pathway VirB6-like protein